jgi:hypothetical protein
MLKSNENNLGDFQNENGNWYTYRKTNNPWALSNNLEFEIDVLDGTRSAIIKKTVAYICVDEDENGNPVLEKWQLKKNVVYSQNA